MTQALTSTMMSPRADAQTAPPSWPDIFHTEIGSGYEVALAHTPDTLFIHVKNIKHGEPVEVVLAPKDRGEWSFFFQANGVSDVKLPLGTRVPPRYSAQYSPDDVSLAITHIDLAPDSSLGVTPRNGEEWGVMIRVFPPDAGPTPLAWLDEGAVLRFAGGRDKTPIALKGDKKCLTGVGLVVIRLDFGASIPQDTKVTVTPKDRFTQLKSKDLSYVKGRIAKSGTYRVRVDIPAFETEKNAEEAEGKSNSEVVSVTTDTGVAAGLSFYVPETWNKLEMMDTHIRSLATEAGVSNPDAEKVLSEFDEMLAMVERFRTPQAKSVLKTEDLTVLEEHFWRVMAAYRKNLTTSGKLGLVTPYGGGKPFLKGMVVMAENAETVKLALEKAQRFALEFVMIASNTRLEATSAGNCLVMPGSVQYHYVKMLSFGEKNAEFNVLVPPVPPANVLPSHLSAARAVAGDLSYWHGSLVAGYRLSYIALDTVTTDDKGTALVYAQADKNPESILKALREGAFYTRISPAPEIDSVAVNGLALSLKRRPFEGMAPTVFLGRAGAPLAMSPGEESTYTFTGEEQFVRVQILAGTAHVGDASVNLLTVMNPVYCSDWVTPWLDEVYADRRDKDEASK